ncbi:MAG: NADH:flavin oxidoreductase/NADH oxidase [Anaerolineae bacterium]
MTALFEPLSLRGVTLRNRIGLSPMCQYSAQDGFVQDWHLSHYGARAIGGVGLMIVEATAVTPQGRITPYDLGLWSDDQIPGLRRITEFAISQGAIPGIQIGHAGRKAATDRPWKGGAPLSDAQGGWDVVGPSAIAFAEGYRTPNALTIDEMQAIKSAFVAAAIRARAAGFQWLEIHGAHGYLLHSFHSPISNQRSDAYGGSLENRTRFTLEIVREIRAVWGDALPLGIRISSTDWIEGGWTLDDSVQFARWLKEAGIDLVDCSSGGTARVKAPAAPGYMIPFAEAVRQGAGIATAAVGLITDSKMANDIIAEGKADVVLLGRELLRDPAWPQRAAREQVGKAGSLLPPQYAWTLEPG